jgi:hypothetical protein
MNTTTLITGNTYPVKDQIKALGGRWNSVRKGWDVPSDNADEAQALVNGAQSSRSNRYVSYEVRTSGGTFYRNHNGRCEDAPCCGCCTI